MVYLNRLAVIVLALSILTGLSPFIITEIESGVVRTSVTSFDANATVTSAENETTARFGVVTEPNLRYGKMPNGSSSIKFVRMNAPRKSMVFIDSRGNISEYLEHPWRLYFKGNKEIRIKFHGERQGYYEGEVRIKTQVPRNRWGKRWLEVRNQLPY